MALEIDRQQPATLPQIFAGILAAGMTASVTLYIAEGLHQAPAASGEPDSFLTWFALAFGVVSLPLGYFIRRRKSPGMGMGILIGTIVVVIPVLLYAEAVANSVRGIKL